MKISKAIEIQEQYLKQRSTHICTDFDAAIKLGKEALEFLEKWRSQAEIQPFPLLRSETIE